MLKTQEPKYDVTNDPASRARIFNRESGEVIPDNEPVFVLRARDIHAVDALYSYEAVCADPEHRRAINARIKQFEQFRSENPDAMKEPDTDAERLIDNLKEGQDAREEEGTEIEVEAEVN